MTLKNSASKIAMSVSRFKRDESGFATLFACFMIMMMVLVGGIGVDIMRAEMERVRLQNTLDRAVLAAADRDQKLTPQEVVLDYMAKSGIDNLVSAEDVLANVNKNERFVEVGSTTMAPTQFMHLMGVDELNVPALSRAEEGISNVEISLVLDVSGSMEFNDRMTNLKKAASDFVDFVLTEDTKDLISISVIPYSEHVNVGTGIYNQLRRIHRHNASYCVEMPDAEFKDTALNTSLTYDQVQHFQWNFGASTWWANVVDDTVCPQEEDFEAITAFSQNKADLKEQINAFTPRAGTSIFLGAKWGAALLDPSTRGIVQGLIANGEADSAFSGRPADFQQLDSTTDLEQTNIPTKDRTIKHLIVMSDGENDRSHRIQSPFYDTESFWQLWADNNFWWFLNNQVPSHMYDDMYFEKYTAEQGDVLTNDICTTAKNDSGIVVWGVGFEVNDHGAGVLENCASSPAHFFRVEGSDISKAFAAIASQIHQLRLTQ